MSVEGAVDGYCRDINGGPILIRGDVDGAVSGSGSAGGGNSDKIEHVKMSVEQDTADDVAQNDAVGRAANESKFISELWGVKFDAAKPRFKNDIIIIDDTIRCTDSTVGFLKPPLLLSDTNNKIVSVDIGAFQSEQFQPCLLLWAILKILIAVLTCMRVQSVTC
jgi:hypothetical protein